MTRASAATFVSLLLIVSWAWADQAPAGKDKQTYKAYVVVFDLACARGEYGKMLADSVRLRLRRHEEYFVLDRLSTQDLSGPVPLNRPEEKVVEVMTTKAGCNIGIYGDVTVQGANVKAKVRCLDLSGGKRRAWTRTFSDDTQRARGEIARMIVEALTGKPEWIPPQYGDEPEPKKLGKPVNLNGDFESGRRGWDEPDNVSTFLVKGPKGRGTILRVRTDLARDPWLEYRRKLRLGLADPKNPPKIPTDTSMGSVAGLEGVHYRGGWIAPKAGWRYWLTVEANKCGGTPKVFVKGFIDWARKADGLPESSLVALGLTPEKFAALPPEKRKALIAEDARKHPDRYRRESYRWYLNLRGPNEWHHYASPCPPRGGLPANVRWLQIQIYSYWPPGTYLWDDCFLYEDPGLKGPVPEEPARTEKFEKSREQTRPE
ncbi:MAG TPA: hypothetical protein VMZ50_06275 [Phycisphaerae bacterium]|nr:hypothetical protein [Phycisphaerae bacterium]